MSNSSNIPGLIAKTLDTIKELGYKPITITNFRRTYSRLHKFCEGNAITNYSEEVGELFINEYRMQQPPVCINSIKNRRRFISHLNATLQQVKWVPAKTPTVEYANSCFDDIVVKYKAYLCKTGKTEKDIHHRILLVARFLQYAQQLGCLSLKDLTTKDVHKAFKESSDKGSFHRLVGAFLRYAYKYKLTDSNLHLIMPSVPNRDPLPSVYTPEEVETLLASIDRSDKTGKRDYAIILIAARIGLRACDIAGLTFDSFCEQKSEIRLIQAKTKNPIKLPFLDEIKEALSDYLNNSRPVSGDKHVFLNADGYRAITPSNVGKIVENRLICTDIDTSKRRKGSHSLRASLATALLDEGNDYCVIQKVLGLVNIQSTKSYVKAGIEKLRINALPVPPPSGNFKKMMAGGAME